ncbi:MAG: tetratricopeptide repeat protein [Gemmatimonadota bacterium]
MKSYQQFLAELKRRHVFKVATIYGVVAFILLQVADLLGQGLRLGDTFMPFVTAIVLLGFPLALIVAWAFELTPEGMQRTSAPAAGEIEGIVEAPASQRWPAGLMALVGVAALVAGAWWVGRQTAPATGGTQTAADGTGAEARAQPDADSRLQLAYVDLSDDPRPSIAVLPFDDMSPEGDQEYFSDGMTEEILNVLAKIRELRVAARTSTFALKDQDLTATQWGDTLGVQYFVEGSVRKAGDQLRITAQLIDAADGSHLWSDQYDRSLDDVFAIQSEIAAAIAGALKIPLGLKADDALVTPTSDMAAYDLYLTGRARMRERGKSLNEAIQLFEAAVARDSNWAPAWAALAEVKEIRIWYAETFDPGEWTRENISRSLKDAEAAARRALESDSRNASAYVALASVQRDRGQWAESEATYRHAIVLDPDHAEAHMQYSELLVLTGRVDEAVRAADRAATLDPVPIRFEILGYALYLDDRLTEAIEAYRLGTRRDPDVGLVYLWMIAADAHVMEGRTEEATALYESAAQAMGRVYRRSQSEPSTASPSRDEIEAYVKTVASSGELAAVPQSMRALLVPAHWMMLDEPDSAIARMLQISGGGPPANIAWEIWAPEVDRIRNDARLQDLLEARDLAGARVQRTPPADRTRPMTLDRGQ